MKSRNIETKIKNYKQNSGKIEYVNSRRNKKVKQGTIVLESVHGSAQGGHIYYLIDALLKQNQNATIYVVIKDTNDVPPFFNKHYKNKVHYVKHLSREYYELLAIAEILINDTTFYPFFNKRPEQKYYIIWHGTPLKYMGKDVPETVDLSNVQRNFYMADRIYVNNTFTKDILARTHHLNNVYQGEMVVAPSPRNDIFFNDNKRNEIRSFYQIEDKKVLVYMPTWRGHIGAVKNSSHLEHMFNYLEAHLDDNTIIFTKLHPFEKTDIKSDYQKIKPFPKEFETYEILAASDGLITDYSSVMFDYANLNKPIILFTYDLESYKQERGLYEDITDYPFTQVMDVQSLTTEIQQLPNTANYQIINKRFNNYDDLNGSNIVARHMLKNEDNDHITVDTLYNNKETVVILSGGFWNNGITTALINTLENIDTNDKNYICFFNKNQIKPEHYYRLLNLPENVHFYPITGEINGNLKDRLLYKQYIKNNNFNFKPFEKQLERMFKEEFSRMFGDLKIDYFIHYTGFERKAAAMLQYVDTKTAIWVHTDMFAEYKAKKNFNRRIIFNAYKKADKIVLVHRNLRKNLLKHVKGINDKVVVVNNFLGEQRTRRLSMENLFMTLKDVHVDYAFNSNEDVYDTIAHNQNTADIINGLKQSYPEVDAIFQKTKQTINDIFEQQTSNDKKTRQHYLVHSVEQQIIQTYMDTIEEQTLKDQFKYLYQDHSKQIASFFANDLSVTIPTVQFQKVFRISKVKMLNALFNPNMTVFINIGRYDYQKGHDKLIQAFEKVYQDNPNVFLIMVCPHGPLRSQTIQWVRESSAKENIVILGGISNPYPLLKHCDAFVLSSNYEGLGLVVYEAIAVGTDAITVNLKETTEYINDQQAIIVENSVEGLVKGMHQKLTGNGQKQPFNFAHFNQQSIKEFNHIFN
ncbi:CDP-glycerol glycerophosphotransferase family protein [Staphylococcus canis]|uniref:Glycosyltransferase n=1 Tax=Staphylococcus canis TaxID=2724942 RepID=A0ABS0T7R0_9STAP|nr:CDP-glycerol glycerophosphotransferase family protein [Staphylococcus canis]MBI5974452.1 glycosyltransferase [Staphylococcus canis]